MPSSMLILTWVGKLYLSIYDDYEEKQFTIMGVNFSKIGQEMTCVYFFFKLVVFIWNIQGKIGSDEQLRSLTVYDNSYPSVYVNLIWQDGIFIFYLLIRQKYLRHYFFEIMFFFWPILYYTRYMTDTHYTYNCHWL